MIAVIQLLAEDVWRILWVIGLAELTLAIALVVTRRGKYLMAMGAVATAGLLLVIIERLWVTDRERIEQIVADMAVAVEHEDAAALVRHLGPNCRFGQLGRGEIEQLAQTALRQVQFDQIHLTQRRVDVYRIRRQARVQFVALSEGSASGTPINRYPTGWVLLFDQTNAGTWQVSKIERIDPVTGRPGGTPIPGLR
jgi:hypothetical protein